MRSAIFYGSNRELTNIAKSGDEKTKIENE